MVREFRIGDKVCLTSDNQKTGIVSEVKRLNAITIDYYVFFGPGEEFWVSADSLNYAVDIPKVPSTISLNQFLSDMALVKFNSSLTDTLYAYRASRTHIEPYQFKPALKFLENANQRLLLADEVGLGKTIEAGIIYLELKARTPMNRFLIVCPSGLIEKWQMEMSNRFGVEVQKYVRQDFMAYLNVYEKTNGLQSLSGIIALETIRSPEIIARINAVNLILDLVIVDEAHHMRNPSTQSHLVGSTLSDAAQAMLLLTATPIQLNRNNLFQLLNILDEGEFDNEDEFNQVMQPNVHINRTSQILQNQPANKDMALQELRSVERTIQKDRYLNNSYYQYICNQLTKPAADETKQLIEIQRGLRDLNTLTHLVNRTTKRDVDPGAVRTPHVIGIDLTQEEKNFYESVLDYVREDQRSRNAKAPVQLVLVTRERQAASCIAVAKEYFMELIENKSATLDDDVSESDLEVEEIDDIGLAKESLHTLRIACEKLGSVDSKLDVFINAMKQVKAETPNSKVLVFATFKNTLKYLEDKLISSNILSTRTVFRIDGDVPIHQRPGKIEQFKLEKEFSVLLLSEVGAEGHDYQFCDVIMNYDLPWNPMKVEQRIGRIDRYGQKAERIRIFSFILNDTIEERILSRLYSRLRIFEESIGDLEPILGDEIAKLEAELFRSNLSPTQQEALLESTIRSIEFKRQESDQFRDNQQRLMGLDSMFDQQARDILNSGRYISPKELAAVVDTFLDEKHPGSRLQDNGDGSFVIKATGNYPQALSSHMIKRRWPASKQGNITQKIQNLRGLPMTFDGQLALGRPNLELVNFDHPIISHAIDYFTGLPTTHPISRLGLLETTTLNVEEIGEFSFVLFSMTTEGVEKSSILKPIVIDHKYQRNFHLEEKLLAILQNVSQRQHPMVLADIDWEAIVDSAQQHFSEIRSTESSKLKSRNDALVNTRIAGLNQTFNSRIMRLQKQLENATDPRIKRMKQGQIDHQKTDLETRIKEVQTGRNVSVKGQLVLAGSLKIRSI